MNDAQFISNVDQLRAFAEDLVRGHGEDNKRITDLQHILARHDPAELRQLPDTTLPIVMLLANVALMEAVDRVLEAQREEESDGL